MQAMELGRSFGTSAFTEYYPNGQAQLYSYTDYNRNTALATPYDVTRATLAASPYAAKTLTTDAFGVAGWGGLPATVGPWDLKADSLLIPRPSDLTLSQIHTPKRKRKTTPNQRMAANIRERRRMCNLNTAFDRLRRRVPAFPHEKRLSRIQTLRLAITYISFMTEILSGQDIRAIIKQNEATKPLVWQPYELGEPPMGSNSAGYLPNGIWWRNNFLGFVN